MRALLTLLFALLVPAVVLPEGATLCLCALLGTTLPKSDDCCRTCCGARSPANRPSLQSQRDCCVHLPGTPAITPKSEKRFEQKLGPVVATGGDLALSPTAFVAPGFTLRLAAGRWRDDRLHPPPPAARSRPLLL